VALALGSAAWVGLRVAGELASTQQPYDMADRAIRSNGIALGLVPGTADEISYPKYLLYSTPFRSPPPEILLTRDGRVTSLGLPGASLRQAHIPHDLLGVGAVVPIAADERLPFELLAAQAVAVTDAGRPAVVSLLGLPTEPVDRRGLGPFGALVEPEYLEANIFRLDATASISDITTKRHDCRSVFGCDETWWLGVLPEGDLAWLLVVHAGPHETLTVLDAVQVPLPREDSPESERVRTNTILSIWKQDRDACRNNPVVMAPEGTTTVAQMRNATTGLKHCHEELALTTKRAPLEQALAAWQAAPNDHIHFSVVDIRPTPMLSRDQIGRAITNARMGLIACYLDHAREGPSQVTVDMLVPVVVSEQAGGGPSTVAAVTENQVHLSGEGERGSANTCYREAFLRGLRYMDLHQGQYFSVTMTFAFK
jgi:hypothetical protein